MARNASPVIRPTARIGTLVIIALVALSLFEVGKIASHAHLFIRAQGRLDIGYSTVSYR